VHQVLRRRPDVRLGTAEEGIAGELAEVAADLAVYVLEVYSKPPFGGSDKALECLARYTHRVAISNPRLLKLEDDRVYFRWKDYARG
jgi:hypothetical protein